MTISLNIEDVKCPKCGNLTGVYHESDDLLDVDETYYKQCKCGAVITVAIGLILEIDAPKHLNKEVQNV